MKSKYLLIALITILYSCSESNEGIPNPANQGPISELPSVFKQKVLIEQYTQASCGQCPKAHHYVDSLLAKWPGNTYAVSIHVADPMEAATNVNQSTQVNLLDSMFNSFALYPAGAVNRDITSAIDMAPDLWFTKTQAKLGQVPSCGLALEAEEISNTNKLNLVVHTGFSHDLSGDYRLQGYIVERRVSSFDSTYDQMNDFSFEGVSPDTTLSLYALNDTIENYAHKYVLKKIIANGGISGDPIPAAIMTKGNIYVKSYTIDLTGINVANCDIIFFVDKYGTTGTTHMIENVQQVPIGSNKDWN